jgi:hypothetical protein
MPESAGTRGVQMPTWTIEELKKVEAADELEIASIRRDGTLRDPVTIWVVRLVDELFVRSCADRRGVPHEVPSVRREHRGPHRHARGASSDAQARPAILKELDARADPRNEQVGGSVHGSRDVIGSWGSGSLGHRKTDLWDGTDLSGSRRVCSSLRARQQAPPRPR